MENKVIYTRFDEKDGSSFRLDELLKVGWIVKSITPETVGAFTTERYQTMNIRGGFVIALERTLERKLIESYKEYDIAE